MVLSDTALGFLDASWSLAVRAPKRAVLPNFLEAGCTQEALASPLSLRLPLVLRHVRRGCQQPPLGTGHEPD